MESEGATVSWAHLWRLAVALTRWNRAWRHSAYPALMPSWPGWEAWTSSSLGTGAVKSSKSLLSPESQSIPNYSWVNPVHMRRPLFSFLSPKLSCHSLLFLSPFPSKLRTQSPGSFTGAGSHSWNHFLWSLALIWWDGSRRGTTLAWALPVTGMRFHSHGQLSSRSSLGSDRWMLPKATEGGKTCLQGPACDPDTNLTIDNSIVNSTTFSSQITGDAEADSRMPCDCQIAAKVESQTSHLQSSILFFSTFLLFYKPTKCTKGLLSTSYLVAWTT